MVEPKQHQSERRHEEVLGGSRPPSQSDGTDSCQRMGSERAQNDSERSGEGSKGKRVHGESSRWFMVMNS
jgi:hypothetical protein